MQAVKLIGALAVVLTGYGCDGDSRSIAGDGGSGTGLDDSGRPLSDSGFSSASCSLVDLVIAVDGSSSMTEELEAMRKTIFPAFAERLPRVGKGLRNFRVATMDACPTPASYHTRGAGGECNFSSGKVWIDSTSPDLKGEFTCVGDLFQGDTKCTGENDDEQPASAAAASLEPPFLGGVNQGFSRPDALLVVLAITDEDEQPTGSASSAEQVYTRLVAAKGDVKRMVFIGVGGGSNCMGAYGAANEAAKLKSTTDKFIAQERGVWHDLCAGAIEDSLDKAFEVINKACGEFPPVI